jgi:2-oxoglutarate ferredoxin oxidoreductase subunit alpha
MVLAANWAGARAMTSTSGPGLSLMTEFVGYGYYAEIPAVIWDIQRIGPSTGLPTRTAQGDLAMVHTMSHGDTRHPILFPSSVRDCFEFGMLAFDLAERLQTPVFVLSDLDLGMNNWMSDPFDYPEKPWDRGKVLDEEALARLPKFERYRDVDGDAIPWRTLPGVRDPKGAYFTRGSGHDEAARYTEKPEEYRRVLDRIARKWDTARTLVPAPLVEEDAGAAVGVVAYGSSHWPVIEARAELKDRGLPTGYLLLKALPLHEEVERFVQRYERVYVVEQNRDGQMADVVRLDTGLDAHRVRSVLYYEGLPLDARTVTEEILRQEGRSMIPENLPEEPGATEEQVAADGQPPGISAPATAAGRPRAAQKVSR